MIAADTSAWIDFFKGNHTEASEKLESFLSEGNLVLPLHVFFEILSAPGLSPEVSTLITELPRLILLPDFWENAAEMQRTILKKRLKARSMDCLIAQNCIDHGVSLISGDQDYRHFVHYGLHLA